MNTNIKQSGFLLAQDGVPKRNKRQRQREREKEKKVIYIVISLSITTKA